MSALRRPAIQELVKADALDLTRLAETDVLEFTASTYPQERLIACRNPLLALERARKREALLQASGVDVRVHTGDASATAAHAAKRLLRSSSP